MSHKDNLFQFAIDNPGGISPAFVRTFTKETMLQTVRANPGLNKPALARLMGCSISTASVLLDALIDRGQVERKFKQKGIKHFVTYHVIESS